MTVQEDADVPYVKTMAALRQRVQALPEEGPLVVSQEEYELIHLLAAQAVQRPVEEEEVQTFMGHRIQVEKIVGDLPDETQEGGRIFVLGGRLSEAIAWRRHQHKNPNQWRALAQPEALAGLREPAVVLIGTYAQRPDYPAFHAMFMQTRARLYIEEGPG